jgi:hypothetical protein
MDPAKRYATISIEATAIEAITRKYLNDMGLVLSPPRRTGGDQLLAGPLYVAVTLPRLR